MLDLTSIYGLRAMATLASLGPGESLNAAGLAERTGVPQQYLSKVMRKFVLAKLVRSQRGPGGGFMLMKAPASIRLDDVLQAIERRPAGGCAFGYAACDPDHPCQLHPLWAHLQRSLAEWSNSYTLADLLAAPTTKTRPRAAR